MLEIPADLHNIFEDRLTTLIKEYPQMVSIEYDEEYYLDCEVLYFDLTDLGEETFISKEIIEETKSFSDEFIYEHNYNKLLNIRSANFQSENEAVIIDTREDDEDDILIEKFSKIISTQITKFISTANNKTKILDMQIALTNTEYLRDNIEVNIENNKLFFTHKSNNILNSFLELPKREKDSLRDKMFFYLKVPHNNLNFEKATIATKPNQPIKMKVCFGREKSCRIAFETALIENKDAGFYEVSNNDNYLFAGITEDDKTLVFKYTELTEHGFTIPLFEEDYSSENYLNVFNDIYSQSKSLLIGKDKIKFILSIAPKDKQKETIKNIAEHNKFSNEIVNILLTINETHTIEALGLVKLYNELLEQDKIKTISHNSNLFATYSDFSKQLEKLRALGFENYYSYSPTNWDSFIKEVRTLKPFFEKLKEKLTSEYKKSVNDFFARIEDDYYDLAPINEKVAKELIIGDNWQVDIKKALNTSKPNFLAIAATIRNKYAEQLRKLEKQLDTNSSNSRQGKKLIEFAIRDNEKTNKVYSAWRNLCVLVHPETSSDYKLIKSSDYDKKIALTYAINVYSQIFGDKKDKSKDDNKKTNKKKK